MSEREVLYWMAAVWVLGVIFAERALVTMREAFATSSTEEENRLRTRLAEADKSVDAWAAKFAEIQTIAEDRWRLMTAAEQRGRAAREMIARLVMSRGGSMFLSSLDLIASSANWEITTCDEPDGSGMRVTVRDLAALTPGALSAPPPGPKT